MPPEEESGLDRIEKRLYANASVDAVTPDHLNTARPQGSSPHAWQNEPIVVKQKKKTSFAVLFFIIAFLFFIAASAIGVYLLLSGDRSVSTNNIDVTVQGPTTIAAGDTVPLSITITNRNPTPLDNADFVVTLPDGSRSADDVTKAYPRYEEKFDTIASGAKIERSVKAVLFGEENQTITIPIEITYSTTGSNAVFKKTSSYTLTVTTSPISMTITTLAETVSGQPLTLDVNVRSNATTPIPGVVMQANYPFGFTVTSQSITPSDSGLFTIGTLNPGETKDIKITGTLSGTGSDARVFQFAAGTEGAKGNLAVAYTSKQASVALAAPFLDVGLAINGSSADNAVIAPGQSVRANVSWKNTLSSEVDNAQIIVSLAGSSINPSTVQVDNGFYQSSDNTIRFDRDTEPGLAALGPGQSGLGSFTFSTTPNASSGTINLQISIKGSRVGQSSVPEDVAASVTKTIRIANNLTLSTAGLHNGTAFTNSGPVPPVANQVTTYGVAWKVDNIVNAVAGVKVTATLPSYVSWTNQSSVSVGAITYNSANRTVTWTLGDLGARSAPAQATFQVSLTPSISQRGTAPTLTSSSLLTGYDRFAQTSLSVSGAAVTTDTPNDPGYRPGAGDVQ